MLCFFIGVAELPHIWGIHFIVLAFVNCCQCMYYESIHYCNILLLEQVQKRSVI